MSRKNRSQVGGTRAEKYCILYELFRQLKEDPLLRISVFYRDNETSMKRSFNTYDKGPEDAKQITKFLLLLLACLIMVNELTTERDTRGSYTGVSFITDHR
jgi:hypothetical protein